MKFHLLTRKIHYWGAIAAALPVVVIICSGILLQVKKQAAWVQPPERKGSGEIPGVSFDQILAACRAVPESGIRTWEDVDRVDVRPGKGMLKVVAKNRWEVQLDSATGKVLQSAYRRSDLIESIHDGSWFHDFAKLWLFLPAGITLLLLWLTGIYLFLLPIRVRRRKAALLRAESLRKL